MFWDVAMVVSGCVYAQVGALVLVSFGECVCGVGLGRVSCGLGRQGTCIRLCPTCLSHLL
jgi:hypothetical protein